jgi:hypothetical protein
MKETLQQTVESIRKHVLKNLELIKTNENHIREVLNWPVSADRTNELNQSYQHSKNLLTENNDFINLQVSIINFLNKYKEKIEKEESVQISVVGKAAKTLGVISREDCFQLTIENDISFDTSHPFYNDSAFLNDLLEYYQNIENYEMCASLLLQKK